MKYPVQDEVVPEIVDSLKNRKLGIFCGAGVSVLQPSNAPAWWDIYVAATSSLADRFIERFPETARHLPSNLIPKDFPTQSLADLIIERFGGEHFAKVLQVVDVADINENHRTIAAFAASGGLRMIATTNFDTMIERAAAVLGAELSVVTPKSPMAKLRANCCLLAKLHGTAAIPSTLVEGSRQKAGQVSRSLIKSWQPLLDDMDMLVVGYSGADLEFGASRTLFDSLAKSNGRIWWLRRPGSSMNIPEHIADRVSCIEGQLPDFLRSIREAAGLADFATPVTGRDARKSLTEVMEIWSRGAGVGPWAAAVFLLSISSKHEKPQSSILANAIIDLALDQAKRLNEQGYMVAEDFPIPNFLRFSGLYCLERMDDNSAETLLETSLRLLLAFENTEGPNDESSRFISAGWSNYGLVQIRLGKREDALLSFRHAAKYAYNAGSAQDFLLGVVNFLHYGIELNDVRRSMQLVQASLQLLDRLGYIPGSIELRLHLATFCCDRNEIWTARQHLFEARRRALSVDNKSLAAIADIQLAECELRRGHIEEGLSSIARLTQKGVASYSRSFEETRRYLNALGVSQPLPFLIRLTMDEAVLAAKRIRSEKEAAETQGNIAWEGAQCRVSESWIADESHARALFEIGILTFAGNNRLAGECSIGLIQYLTAQGKFLEVTWAADNLISNPDVPLEVVSSAYASLAHSYAALGRLDEARTAFDKAESGHLASSGKIPQPLAEAAMWFHVQDGNHNEAFRWATLLAQSGDGSAAFSNDMANILFRLDSWGASWKPLTEAINQSLNVESFPQPTEAQKLPYRMFNGFSNNRAEPKPDVLRGLKEASDLAEKGAFERALAIIDETIEHLEEPAYEAGIAVARQVEFLSHIDGGHAVEAAVTARRNDLSQQMAIIPLACLERGLCWTFVRRGEAERAIEAIRRYSWIGELVDEPTVSAALQAWSSLLSEGDHISYLLRPARFFGLQEATLQEIFNVMEDRLAQKSVEKTITTKLGLDLAASLTATDANAAVGRAIEAGRRARVLSIAILIEFREMRALWALRQGHNGDAAVRYRRLAQRYRKIGEIDGALNAMAGEARMLSRLGEHETAIETFNRAIAEAKGRRDLSGLVNGLAMAHVRVARRADGSWELYHLDRAIESFVASIEAAEPASRDCAYSRIGLAYANAMKGLQVVAISMLDLAISDLAHLGDPYAASLQEIRENVIGGDWSSLVLD